MPDTLRQRRCFGLKASTRDLRRAIVLCTIRTPFYILAVYRLKYRIILVIRYLRCEHSLSGAGARGGGTEGVAAYFVEIAAQGETSPTEASVFLSWTLSSD